VGAIRHLPNRPSGSIVRNCRLLPDEQGWEGRDSGRGFGSDTAIIDRVAAFGR